MNYENPSESFVLFNAYWWLIFPLLGMAFGLIKIILAHRRANRGLDILKSYIDQGKEPPAELMQYLRAPAIPNGTAKGPGSSIFLAILFAGIAAAFTLIAINERDHDIYFVVIIMAAMAVGFLAKAIANSKQNRLDRQ